MQIPEYLDRIRRRQQLNSDRELARELGLSHGAISQFRIGFAYPSIETMMQLAEHAGVDADTAKIDLVNAKMNSPQAHARKDRQRQQREQLAADLQELDAVLSETKDDNRRTALARIKQLVVRTAKFASIAALIYCGTPTAPVYSTESIHYAVIVSRRRRRTRIRAVRNYTAFRPFSRRLEPVGGTCERRAAAHPGRHGHHTRPPAAALVRGPGGGAPRHPRGERGPPGALRRARPAPGGPARPPRPLPPQKRRQGPALVAPRVHPRPDRRGRARLEIGRAHV